MRIKEVLDDLEAIVPLNLAEDWDHSGLQIGNAHHELQGVLLCLNVDAYTIKQAIETNCNLIISHHPFLFNRFNTIDLETTFGQNIEAVLSHHITVYAMHTNYDKVRMNLQLLRKLGCKDVVASEFVGFGILNKASQPLDFMEKVKQTFGLAYLRVVGHLPNGIQKISMCAGAGHDFINEALDKSDVYLTGDLTYTHAMDIILRKQGAVIEVPHFIEAFFKEDLGEILTKQYQFRCVQADEKDYFQIY